MTTDAHTTADAVAEAAEAAADHSQADWSIQEIARLAGTTSRTLRHYGSVGLLEPSRIGQNGYRYYDAAGLVRLQRILLLRDLGLGLPAIAEVLESETDARRALSRHLDRLEEERERLSRQIAAVQKTITTMEEGGRLMAETMFDGFDHTRYEREVGEKWGRAAYVDSDRWWRSKTEAEKAEWQGRQAALAAEWTDAALRGTDPVSPEAQALAARQAEWLGAVPGTPGFENGRPTREYFEGLAEMYVADDRFAANYGGAVGAAFVRAAMLAYAAAEL